jgi:hypothetical protein
MHTASLFGTSKRQSRPISLDRDMELVTFNHHQYPPRSTSSQHTRHRKNLDRQALQQERKKNQSQLDTDKKPTYRRDTSTPASEWLGLMHFRKHHLMSHNAMITEAGVLIGKSLLTWSSIASWASFHILKELALSPDRHSCQTPSAQI